MPTLNPLANRLSRLAAVIIDIIFAWLLAFVGYLVGGMPQFPATITTEAELMAFYGEIFSVPFIIASLIAIGVQIYLLTKDGQTVGKKLMKIRIVKVTTGQNGGLVPNVLLRGIVNTLLTIIPIIGGLYGLIDVLFIFRGNRRCIHDLIAGTVVVKA